MTETNVNEKILETFIKNFLKEIEEYKNLFKQLGLNINNYLPDIFTNEFLGIQAIYSVDTQHILFRFDKRDENHVCTYKVEGEIFDFFDPFKTWNKNQAAFYFDDSYGNILNSHISGMRPAIFRGKNLECSFKELTFDTYKYGRINIDYALVFSYSAFNKWKLNIRDFLSKFITVIQEFKKQETTPHLYRDYLEKIKQKMEMIFYNETVPELEIDKFIEMNPIVLEFGLNITNPLSQTKLKNILNIYEHDLKPDLIAYDNRARNWVIVDYKKAKRSILKNVGKVRTGFRSEVYALKDQLRNYVRYFQERDHRNYFKNRYGIEIKRPRAIGIIGNISNNEKEDFENLLIDEFDYQYSLVPYNFLFENFLESVDFAFKFVK